MKKFLSLACVYLCFALGIQFFNEESVAEAYFEITYTDNFASPIYVYREDGIDYYVSGCFAGADLWHNKYGAFMELSPPRYSNYYYFFYLDGSKWRYEVTFIYYANGKNYTTGRTGKVSEDARAQKVFNIVYSRMQNLIHKNEEQKQLEKRRQAEEQRRREAEKRRQEEERKRLAEENRRRKEAEFNSLITQGDNFYSAKNYVAAIQSYDKAKNLDKNSVDKFFGELVKNGDKLSAQGNYPAAFDYYKKAVTMNPSESALDKIVTLFGKSGNLADEENFCKALTEYNPNNIFFNVFLGSFYVQTGEFEKALAPLTKASEILPGNPQISAVLGATYLMTKKYDEAIKHFNNTLKLSPKNFEAHYFLGIVYEQKKDYKTAKKYLKQALKIKPNDSDAKEALNRVSKAK